MAMLACFLWVPSPHFFLPHNGVLRENSSNNPITNSDPLAKSNPLRPTSPRQHASSAWLT